ncbi:MAG: hypothetical protein HKP58_05720 [Desulfatitalea sp.]|nr:hypothetical protein [Desulfatitalea sp.]NNJ99893.1 hypothetical protein [Desulfatitalea sp.]
MLIYDHTFAWEGFGGLYQLAAGECRLRIIDLTRQPAGNVMHLRPMVVVVSDLPDPNPRFRNMSVRSCASHIATLVAAQFNIPPHRMTYVEYYAPSTYGINNEHAIPAKLDVVEFTWFDDKALHPKWQPLASPLRKVIEEWVAALENKGAGK